MFLNKDQFTGKVFFGTGCSETLKQNICAELGQQPSAVKIKKQNDGEIWVQFLDNIRDQDVYLVQSTQMPYENFYELLILADAALRSSARQITLVVPYLLHTRQERKDKPRVSLTAKLVAKQISFSGANRIILLDLHAPATQGFFNENLIKVDEVFASMVFAKYIKQMEINLKNTVFISPDVGALKKTRFFAEKFNAGLAFIDKKRIDHGESDSLSVTLEIGDSLKGKTAIFVDDIVDTGGTLVKAAELVSQAGSPQIYAFVTHAVFSQAAVKKIADSIFDKFFVTDSIPQKKLPNKIQVLSVGNLLGKAIKISNQKNQSLSSLFK